MKIRVLAVAAAVIAASLLAGCAGEGAPRRTVVPTPDATSASTPDATSTPTQPASDPDTGAPTSAVSTTPVACTNGLATVAGAAGRYALSGDCAAVTIAGNDLSLQVDGSIGTMTLQGDRSHVTGGADVSKVRTIPSPSRRSTTSRSAGSATASPAPRICRACRSREAAIRSPPPVWAAPRSAEPATPIPGPDRPRSTAAAPLAAARPATGAD